jgi:archaemetzincin
LHQLNLNDLLDAAIEILPADAYALIMLVEHDMFEDEDDEDK